MDSPVALALMAKAKLVFERDGTFLSFPLVPYAYDPPRLASVVSGGEMTAETLQMLSEFSGLVNMLPLDAVWAGDDRRLWDVYDDVLRNAKLASAKLNAEDRKAYQAARRVLVKQKSDGTVEDSGKVKIYKQHRDRWITARQDYNNRKIAAESSSDETVKQQWKTIDEPALRQRLSLIESKWIANGFKAEVEEAQRTVAALEGKTPTTVWAGYLSRFDKDLESLTDTSGQRFVPSGFSPSNAIEGNGWLRFTLSSDEATALVDHAPPELKARLAPDRVDLDIDMLTFEYTSVAVTRPWFASEVFNARFWKFSDPTKVLSDGKTPPSGLCTAYVAAIVLARKVEIRLKPDSARNSVALDRLAAGRRLSLGSLLIERPAVAEAVQPRVLVATPARLSAAAVAQPITPAVAAKLSPAVLRLRHTAILRLPPVAAADPAPAANPLPPPPPAVQQSDDVHVMAFICKRLPASPNPDPKLDW